VSTPDQWVPEAHAPLDETGGALHLALEDRDKDEWSYHLFERFEQLGRGLSAETRFGADGSRWEERWFNDESKDLVRLMIFNTKTGLYVILGTRDGGDKDAEDAYRDAVAYAIENTGKRRESVAWEATIAQVPARRGLRRAGLRVGGGRAHDLEIASWGSVHTEEVPTWFPAGGGVRGGPWPFWPIRVTGSVSCYSWEEDGTEAVAARLRYLVELLTLAFDVPMDVRVGPYDPTVPEGGEEDLVVPGIRNPTLPEDHPWAANSGPTEVPEWVTDALDGKTKTNTTVRQALAAHYEGMQLKSDHPSMALLAFVASIESLATPRKGLPRCGECDAVLESGKRFRDALAGVLSPDEVVLVGNAYNRRSRTVHDGRLHGSEDVLGMPPLAGFYSGLSPGVRFELGTVDLAAKASRELLLARFMPSPAGESGS